MTDSTITIEEEALDLLHVLKTVMGKYSPSRNRLFLEYKKYLMGEGKIGIGKQRFNDLLRVLSKKGFIELKSRGVRKFSVEVTQNGEFVAALDFSPRSIKGAVLLEQEITPSNHPRLFVFADGRKERLGPGSRGFVRQLNE